MGEEVVLELLGCSLGVGWGSGNAVGLDSEVGGGLAHGEVEEAVVAPVSSPGVSALPVLLAGGGVLAVADNGDLVVDHGEADGLLVDVVTGALDNLVVGGLEGVGGVDTAGDGAVSVELSLHVVGTLHAVVVRDVVLLVVDGLAVGIGGLALRGRRAVTADIVVGAHAVDQVVSGVLFAGRVGDAGCVSVPVDASGVATVAGATSLAVNDGLGIDADRGWVEATVQDVESIGDSGGGALSPA